MIKNNLHHIFFFLVLLSIVGGCKVYDSHSNLLETMEVPFVPTLIIDSTLIEHQLEGEQSDVYRKVEITENVNYIPQWSLAIISSLEEVKLSSKIKVIDDNAFFSCKNLKRINLSHVESIGENCFKFAALEEVDLKKTRIIKDFAFSNCHNLREVELSGCLKEIGDFAFNEDTALVACNVSSGKIGMCAFAACSNLRELSLGKVVCIGKAAFLGCVSLSSIVIPSTVREIESEAFFGCNNLKQVIVESRNTRIAENAFEFGVEILYQ